jgi:DNA repair protein RecN (Recombination protein N)
VTAEFELADGAAARAWLAANDLEEGEGAACCAAPWISTGRSRAFVNGRPATVAQLRELGEHLLDIHGQHEHQLLLRATSSARWSMRSAAARRGARGAASASASGSACRAARARERAQASSAREREMLAHEIRELEQLGFDPPPGPRRRPRTGASPTARS